MAEVAAMTDLPYRPAAAIMLLNREGRVFVGQRIDNVLDAWQMPQGGLDKGEAPLDGALRELEEETGIPAARVALIAAAPTTLDYDLPPELQGKMWGGRYRGQRQHWFLMRYLGRDDEIDLATEHPEFRAWKWVEPADLPSLIVPFKVALYRSVLAAFASHLASR